ncbi:MAG: helix-turn-helix domain-containing protein [Actinobacteria bacterium]|nr:MAG: helix-turn-helix domain-containing protein [Actinomycetota bacterium]
MAVLHREPDDRLRSSRVLGRDPPPCPEGITGNVSKTCRYYGITRQAYRAWLRRSEELGLEGLRDRSRRPHVSPNATRTEVVGKIV